MRPYSAHTLKCEDCKTLYEIPRNHSEETRYVLDRIDAKVFKGMKVLNLDDEQVPIAKDKVKDSKHFVKAELMASTKVGKRLVIYAGKLGKKGKKNRTQIFVEPETKRLSFDQTDLHPTEVFTELEATFKDGSKHIIKKKKHG